MAVFHNQSVVFHHNSKKLSEAASEQCNRQQDHTGRDEQPDDAAAAFEQSCQGTGQAAAFLTGKSTDDGTDDDKS